MRKFLSQVVAMLLVALIAAPAAMAQGEKALAPLSRVMKVEGKFENTNYFPTTNATEALRQDSQIKGNVTSKDVRGYMSRKNAAKLAPSFAAGSESFNAVTLVDGGEVSFQMNKFSAQAPCTAEELSQWTLTYGCNLGAVMGADKYYVVDAEVNNNKAYFKSGNVYNPETWALESQVELTDLSCLMFAATYDPSTGNIYANSYKADGSGLQFGIFDPATFTTSNIADIDVNYGAFSCSLDGTLYAMTTDGDFGTINKANGEFTLIKSTGLATQYLTSGAIDHMAPTPTFYWATCVGLSGNELYAIDCATGAASLVYEFNNGQEVKGMYFELPTAEEKAPGMATLTSVDFEGAALTGTVTFTTPATLFNKENAPAGQTLRYEVIANGQVLQSGSGLEYGHSYKVKAEVAAAGLYSFSVIVYNEVGPSPKSNVVTVWLGPDAPAQVKNVNASWAADKMTVAWDAVTTGAHDGVIGNVTYAIYNAADSTLIKDALTATTYTFDLKEPVEYTEYQYYVVATCDGDESEPALSNVVGVGKHNAPFTTAVNSSATPDWTVIDVNADKKTWKMMADAAQYNYSTSKAGDDWLITYPIAVKKGYLYKVTIMAKAYNTRYPEKFEVKAGNAATAEAMTIDVIEPTTITTTTYTPFSGTFIASADEMYVGIHAISTKNQYYLLINEFSIDGGVNSGAPALATDLNVLVPYSGENKATLSYTTPTTTVTGDELTGNKALTRVEVLVNDKLEYVDNKPTAGAMSSIEIDLPEFGVYNFQVIAYNNAGAGEIAEISAYVGINVPGDVTNASVVEVSDGVVNISWDAVTTDVDGNVMNPALVNYTVAYPYFDADDQLALDIIAENITETSLNNVKAVAEGQQEFVQYMIFANSEAGSSEGVVTDMVAVGTPYDVPYDDTFANGKLQHILGYSGDSPYIFTAKMGFDSRNKDNGYIAFIHQYIEFLGTMWIGDGETTLMTGKIAVTEKDPELSFYYAGVSDKGTNPLTTLVVCDGDTTEVNTVEMNTTLVWKRNAVDMKAFAGKTVQLLFKAKHTDYYAPIQAGMGLYGLIDDIRLGDPIKVDLVAENISAPSVVATEQAFDIDYTIYNQGTEEAKNVFVSLFANGNLVESCVDTLTVAAGQTINGTFNHQAYNLFENGSYEFSFVVDCEADQDLTNNTSELVKVAVANSDLPTLQLSGTTDIVDADSTATIKLAWDVPAIDVSEMDVVEGFESESYPAFTTENFGGWTLLNFNSSNTYIIDGANFPNGGTAFGWILFDAVEAGLDQSPNFAPYEGSCYMAAFAHEQGANDAWLVSPNMGGIAQTVTFMARSATAQYGAETMECLVSMSGKDKADFTNVTIKGYNASTGANPDAWTEYSIDLPAGTQYFAIRSTATDCFALMVDNIQYHYTSPFYNLELKGYDVYRNKEKLTAAPINVEEYTDVVKQEGTYDYTVVAVYNEGNSAPSNVYSAEVKFTSGIADAVVGAKVAVEGNEIVVTGAEEVTIAAVDGKLVYAGESARVAVAAGVYVVKADNTVVKVIVK